MMEHSTEDLIPKAEMFPEVSMIGQGLLYELLESPQFKLDESLLDVIRQLLGIPVSKSNKIDPYKVAEVLKVSTSFCDMHNKKQQLALRSYDGEIDEELTILN